MARLLTSKGYSDVHPLLGGFDAWVALGYPVDSQAELVQPLTPVAAEAQ
ncbi:MAG: hypothetical protein ACM3NO_01665 [Deltaproteobacteria bacterium]